MRKEVVLCLLCSLILFISAAFPAFAAPPPEMPPPSGPSPSAGDSGSGAASALTAVVAAVGEDEIVVGITEYATAYAAGRGDRLYDYLSGETGIVLNGVVSGEKYMDITAYATAYAADSAGAIRNTPALSPDEISTYQRLEGFDDEGHPILIPVAESEFKVIDIY